MSKRILWFTTSDKGSRVGDYTRLLWPHVEKAIREKGGEPRFFRMDPNQESSDNLRQILSLEPQIVHFQMEPQFFLGARLMADYRAAAERSSLFTTFHGIQDHSSQARWFDRWLNLFKRRGKRGSSFAKLDGILVHSDQEKSQVERLRMGHPILIPPVILRNKEARSADPLVRSFYIRGNPVSPEFDDRVNIVVFGYFSPERGQDIAIEALLHLSRKVRLTLAGGARRSGDHRYLDHCLNRARALGVRDRVSVTGIVEPRYLDALYRKADIVLNPSRSMQSLGPLEGAFAEGTVILTADLPFTREIEGRLPGCLEFFKKADAKDCALKIERLINDREKRLALKDKATEFASLHAPERAAQEYVSAYERFL